MRPYAIIAVLWFLNASSLMARAEDVNLNSCYSQVTLQGTLSEVDTAMDGMAKALTLMTRIYAQLDEQTVQVKFIALAVGTDPVRTKLLVSQQGIAGLFQLAGMPEENISSEFLGCVVQTLSR